MSRISLSKQQVSSVISLVLFSTQPPHSYNKAKHFPFVYYPYLILLSLFSCELGSRTFAKFDELAENINTRDDVKLAYVNCDDNSEFCESKGVNGKPQAQIEC